MGLQSDYAQLRYILLVALAIAITACSSAPAPEVQSSSATTHEEARQAPPPSQQEEVPSATMPPIEPNMSFGDSSSGVVVYLSPKQAVGMMDNVIAVHEIGESSVRYSVRSKVRSKENSMQMFTASSGTFAPVVVSPDGQVVVHFQNQGEDNNSVSVRLLSAAAVKPGGFAIQLRDGVPFEKDGLEVTSSGTRVKRQLNGEGVTISELTMSETNLEKKQAVSSSLEQGRHSYIKSPSGKFWIAMINGDNRSCDLHIAPVAASSTP